MEPKQVLPVVSRLEKRCSSGCGLNALSSSCSHEKRRRVLKSKTYHSGLPLRQARAAFASNQKPILLPLPRRHSNSPPRTIQQQLESQSVPLNVTVPNEQEPQEGPAVGNGQPKDDDDQQQEDKDDDEIAWLLDDQLQQDDAKLVARALERLGSIFKREAASECHRAVSLGGPHKLLYALDRKSVV